MQPCSTKLRVKPIPRATQDMRKAGLNPILAYSQGGATSPAGASAHMQNVAQAGVSTAMEANRQSLEVQLLKAQTELATYTAKQQKIDTDIAESPLGWASKIAEWSKPIWPFLAFLIGRRIGIR